MATFTDNAGDEWRVAFTFGLLDRIKAEAGFDLAAAMEDHEKLAGLLFKGLGRPLVEALYVACADQVEERGLTPEDWAHRFDGPAVERATVAVLEAVADFFPRTRVGEKIRGDLPGLLKEMDDHLIRVLEQNRRKSRAGSSGPGSRSPGSSASPPAPSASDT